jgi:hypothetical protein
MSQLWYFAYGANMSDAVLARRGLRPLASEAGWVDGHALRFSHRGLLPTEPAFANLEPERTARVHGVLHRIRADDLVRLDKIEGAEYAHVDLLATGSRSGALTARAYLDPYPVRGLLPSRRYLRCVCEGAERFDLPAAWREELQAHPSRYVPVLSELTTACVGIAERLRRSGLRPEVLRMRILGQKPRGSR